MKGNLQSRLLPEAPELSDPPYPYPGILPRPGESFARWSHGEPESNGQPSTIEIEADAATLLPAIALRDTD